jgi:hypothetical protein
MGEVDTLFAAGEGCLLVLANTPHPPCRAPSPTRGEGNLFFSPLPLWERSTRVSVEGEGCSFVLADAPHPHPPSGHLLPQGEKKIREKNYSRKIHKKISSFYI